MTAFRRLLAQRHLALAVCAAALLLRLLVPAGYMIGTADGHPMIELCSGVASEPMAMPGMHGDTAEHGKKDHGKGGAPCPFASLAATALVAIDPTQLALLVAFLLAVGLCPAVLPEILRPTYLRPPLRGPPANL